MDDVLDLGVAGPCRIGLARCQWCTHGVDTGDELAIGAQYVEHSLAHAGHDFHVHGHVGAVRQFDTDVGNRAAQRAHAERHHVHRAASHAPVKQRL